MNKVKARFDLRHSVSEKKTCSELNETDFFAHTPASKLLWWLSMHEYYGHYD
jgi:hypothetical protein